MKRLLMIACFAAVSVTGCATLRNANGSLNVVGILSDASYGLDAACYAQWVPADDCTIGHDAINAATALAVKNLPGVSAAVKQSILDVETTLPASSRLRPYLDAIVLLLK